jgi:hypothetical protein
MAHRVSTKLGERTPEELAEHLQHVPLHHLVDLKAMINAEKDDDKFPATKVVIASMLSGIIPTYKTQENLQRYIEEHSYTVEYIAHILWHRLYP